MKTTFKKVMALTMITSSLFIAGCQKDLYDPEYAASKDAPIKGIPSDFNWSTISSVNLTVNVDDQYNGEYYYIVEVFDSNPVIDSNAKLLTKGVAKKGQTFNTEFSIPQTLKSIAIRQTTPTGISVTRVVDVASTVTMDFAATTTRATTRSVSSYVSTKSISVSESDFATSAPTGAEKYIQDNQGKATNFTLSDGFNEGINLWKSDKNLYASGKVHITSLGLASGCKLYLLPGAEVTLDGNNSFGQSGTVISVSSDAKLILNGSTEIGNNVKLLNKGTIQATAASAYIRVSNSGQLYNEGTITLAGKLSGENTKSYIENKGGTITALNFELAGNSSMTNAGTVNITGQASITSTDAVWRNESGTFTAKNMEIYGTNLNSFNACKLIVTDFLNLNDCKLIIDAGASVSCKTLYINNTRIELGNKAILNVKEQANLNYNAGLNGIYGTGTEYALLKVKKAIQNTAGKYPIVYYGGKLQIESSNHVAQAIDSSNPIYGYDKTVEWVKEGESTVSITSIGCSEGNTPATGGNPSNPTFPVIVNPGINYTYAMEDLWPNYGDYDMNDLVVSITPSFTLYDANHVETLIIKTDLRAIGASKSLGAAFQLDKVAAGNVTGVAYSVTSTDKSVFEVNSFNVESNQKMAVIPLFDNAQSFLGTSGITNTVKGGKKVPAKTVTITITFNKNKVSQNDIDIKNLNFFIVTDKKKTDRTEVHLAEYNATDKANTSLFGTGDDKPNGDKKYLSKDNLVWGMMIPANFDYPAENTSILKAYDKFESWASDGGKANVDWYNSPNSDSIYK